MKVKDILTDMESRVFNGLYLKDICKLYDMENFDDIEAEYKAGQDHLVEVLTNEQSMQLAKMEAAYTVRRSYAAEFGFKCGICGAFRQFFGYVNSSDGGFHDLVVNDLLTMPKMMRHKEYYEKVQLCNEIDAAIMPMLSERDQEHLVSICAAWSQRVYSAALHGFYCGYRAAYNIMESIDPLVKVKSADKILLMEYHLGFITPYSEVERLRELNAA